MRVFTLVLALLTIVAEIEGQVTKDSFGKTADGAPVDIYTLKSGAIEARILTYGGIIQSLRIPDRSGKTADVVLGFDSIDGYAGGAKPNPAYFGALIGRYANRVGGAKFVLDGQTWHTPVNEGVNTLHGGTQGFDKRVWKAKEIPHGIELTLVSPDGDQGFPGTLTAVVRYTLTGKELKIDYSATTDKDTVLNLTNHSYFNLAGQGVGDILQNQVKINASRYTPVDENLIPTGELAPVEGTPFDFRKPTAVGARINDDHDQLKKGRGYDHNWVLDKGGKLAEAAEVYEPSSGRVLTVLTDQPGVQFYTGNFLDGTITGKEGKVYGRRSALCLETQHFPDSPNHPKFPSAELKPGERYHQVTVFRFSAR
ncbi:MAG: galactose mutarotase [Acidobacteria bacterium]|nr:galactose mutarotase [Acidobacteriota bacterium]